MGEIQKIIDLNAHVENIEYRIEANDNETRAFISFDNLGYGTITAIKFNAQGYNSFGDAVQLNFPLIIQDISIGKNCHAQDLSAILPNRDIRKLVLTEWQVCYGDGSVTTYEGNNSWTFNLQELDAVAAAATKDEYGCQFDYMPLKFDGGWICGCGRYNGLNDTVCTKCGNAREHVMKLSAPGYISELIEKHQGKERERQKKAAAETAKKAEASKGRKLAIGIVCFFLLAVAIIATTIMTSEKHATYSSREEMRDALQGTYTYWDHGTELRIHLTIIGDKATYKFNTDFIPGATPSDDIESDITEWGYKKGVIHTYEDLTVTPDGDLKDKNGHIYYKINLSEESFDELENGRKVMDFSDVETSNKDGYTVCTGTITNTGQRVYINIKIQGGFTGPNGASLEKEWTTIDRLAPGESTTFKISVPENADIIRCIPYVEEWEREK